MVLVNRHINLKLIIRVFFIWRQFEIPDNRMAIWVNKLRAKKSWKWTHGFQILFFDITLRKSYIKLKYCKVQSQKFVWERLFNHITWNALPRFPDQIPWPDSLRYSDSKAIAIPKSTILFVPEWNVDGALFSHIKTLNMAKLLSVVFSR